MNFSNFKLSAKKSLVKNYGKCFFASIFPSVTIILLTVVNYYIYIFLNKTDFSFLPFVLSYENYIRVSLFTLSLCVSYVLWQSIRVVCEYYLYLKSKNNKITFNFVIKKITFSKIISSCFVSIIKFFLTVAWCGFYYFPSVVMTAVLYYYLQTEPNSYITVTVAVSILMLLVIATGFLYVTLKRYSMSDVVLFSADIKDPLKIIAEGIRLMENNSKKYALYCLSFLGWKISCLFLLPLFYVLPYCKLAKYDFYNSLLMQLKTDEISEKPIIFFIMQKNKA